MNKLSKKDLSAWREKHFKELEETLRVAKDIRDNPQASNRDRIEAAKLIARLLHSLQPDKVSTPVAKHPSSLPAHKPPELSPEAREKLRGILSPTPPQNVN